MVLFLFVAAVLFFGYRVTTPADRERYRLRALEIARILLYVARHRPPALLAFRAQLRARTPYPVVVSALIALNVGVFGLMLFGAGAHGDPVTLVAWGASVGIRTTNGEWWRLLTSTFVHATMFHLLVNVGVLATVGVLLERYVGSLAVLTVYLAGGVLAAVVNIYSHPVVVSFGASGAVLALYGLLAAHGVWSLLRLRTAAAPKPEQDLSTELHAEETAVEEAPVADGAFEEPALAIPLVAFKRLVPATVIFVLYSLGNDGLVLAAELLAFGAGLGAGIAMTRDVRTSKPSPRLPAFAMAASAVVALVLAVPVRGLADVKPEIVRVVALETRTTGIYDTAYAQFKKSRGNNGSSLAQVIEGQILPDLKAADERLKALNHVPPEHQPFVEDAERYVRLRSDSWRLRADGLRKAGVVPKRDEKEQVSRMSDEQWRVRAENQHRTNLVTFGKAEGAERASLEALRRIEPFSASTR